MARDFAAGTDAIISEFSAHATLRTYSCWMWWDTKGGSNEGRLFDKREGGSAREIVSFFTASGQPFAYRRVWSTATGIWKWDTDPPSGQWNHIAVTYDAGAASNDPVLFLDGVSVASTELQAPLGGVQGNADKYILGNRGSGTRGWDGRIAEFAIWDRILSDAEIASLGKGFSPLFYTDALVCYIPLVRDVIDYLNDDPGTVTGTTVIEHPPTIFYPGRSVMGTPAAPPSGTAEERRSVSGIWLPLIPGVTPNVAQDQEWRQESAWSYSGILAVGGTLTLQSLVVVATGVTVLSTVVTFTQTLAPAAVGVPTLIKKMFVTLAATATGVPGLVKKMFVTLSATAVGVAVLAAVQLILKALAATAVGVATLTFTQLLLQTLAATAVGVATLVPVSTFFQSLLAVATAVPTLTKKMFKTLAATAVGVAGLTKGMFVTLSASAIGVAVLATALKTLKALSAVATGVASLTTLFIAGVAAVGGVMRRRRRRHRREP